jgi:hypothetical protein
MGRRRKEQGKEVLALDEEGHVSFAACGVGILHEPPSIVGFSTTKFPIDASAGTHKIQLHI